MEDVFTSGNSKSNVDISKKLHSDNSADKCTDNGCINNYSLQQFKEHL